MAQLDRDQCQQREGGARRHLAEQKMLRGATKEDLGIEKAKEKSRGTESLVKGQREGLLEAK